MEAEVSELVGAARGERVPDERLTHRTGYRARTWSTRAGEIELAIPKIRRGSYFPSFLEPRRRSEQALVSVVQEAYVAGVSTRKVDQVVESLGLRISKSEVSRICAGLDEQVDAFRNRPLEGRYPCLWLDAKVEKVRDGGRVVRKALVLAYAVHESGYREVIGLDVGESETEVFWRSFLRGLVERGLSGVQLVVSDAHAGLKKAIAQVLGCPWQRCSVHFLREALGHARREQQPMLAALIRPIFNAETGEQARELLGEALERLRTPLPKIHDLLAFYAFPTDHHCKLRSTNPLPIMAPFRREVQTDRPTALFRMLLRRSEQAPESAFGGHPGSVDVARLWRVRSARRLRLEALPGNTGRSQGAPGLRRGRRRRGCHRASRARVPGRPRSR